MNPEETGRILAIAAAYDARTVGNADVIAWQKALDDIDFADAQAAVVAHYRETRDRIMPADVRHHVKATRADRISRPAIPAPPAELTDQTRAYSAHLTDAVRAIADGRSLSRALAAREPDPPNDTYRTGRGPTYPQHKAALTVACPWPGCAAEPGQPCRNTANGRPLRATPAHPSRIHAAEHLQEKT